MRQHRLWIAAFLVVMGLVDSASAGQRAPGTAVPTSAAGGARIVGVVRDEAGRGVGGATIIALGTSLALARSAATGAFELVLPTGEYVLRVLRTGYVSPFREAVRVGQDMRLERTITLTSVGEPILAATPETGTREGVAPGETAWRLRHLPRTVLRDATSGQPGEAPVAFGPIGRTGQWAEVAAHRRPPVWDASPFTGHVDLLTTGAVGVEGDLPISAAIPRGVAYVVVGAPVGRHGRWSARAAISPSDASAWTFLADYTTRTERAHAFDAGVAYSSQTLPGPSSEVRVASAPLDVRRVAGAYANDRWTVGRGFQVAYGTRIDRVDYLAEPLVIGGTAGARQALVRGVSAFATTTRRRVAPGAWVFQPPIAESVWLPPDHTFSSVEGQPLRAATVDRHQVGMTWSGQRFGSPIDVHVSRMREVARGQGATLFAFDQSRRAGHFVVAPLGVVVLDGVSVGVAGTLAPHVRGRVDYVVAMADWRAVSPSRSVEMLVDQLARPGGRRHHDVTSSFEAFVPATDTSFNVTLRMNDAFGRASGGHAGVAARFALEVRQPLAFSTLGADTFTVFMGARNLHGDVQSAGYFDDLATVAPPLRLTGGIQVRF